MRKDELPSDIITDIEACLASRERLGMENDRDDRYQRAKEYHVWRRDVFPVIRASIPVQHELVTPKGLR